MQLLKHVVFVNTCIFVQHSCNNLMNVRGGGGGQLPNKGRYGCVVSAKPSPDKISPKNLMPGQITAKNLLTRQVFITFRVPKLKIFSK